MSERQREREGGRERESGGEGREVERPQWASPVRRPAANGPTCPARAARAARVLARPILAQYAIINLNCSSAGALPRAANTWYSSSHDSLILWSESSVTLQVSYCVVVLGPTSTCPTRDRILLIPNTAQGGNGQISLSRLPARNPNIGFGLSPDPRSVQCSVHRCVSRARVAQRRPRARPMSSFRPIH